MKVDGEPLEGLEHGNAWALRRPEQPSTNWLVGDHAAIPLDSLRFVGHGSPGRELGSGPSGGTAEPLEGLAIKWFQHTPQDDPGWGRGKPTSVGRTLSLLAGPGAFELSFRRDGRTCTLVLEHPGDFAIWGEGLEHRWRALEPSTVLTVRWQPGSQQRNGGTGEP
jgi:hypothetical protein